jgi:hypothetical protein
MRRGAAIGAALAAAALALAGCGAATRTAGRTPPPPPPAFATSPAGGVGATVDFAPSDAVTRALHRALPGAALAVASVVNDAGQLMPVPTFTAAAADGRAVPLVDAWRRLAGRDDPAARRARALLPLAATMSGGGSALVYLTLTGLAPADVASVAMLGSDGDVTRLGRTR